MAKHCAGFVVVGEVVTVVDAEIPNGSDEPVTIIADHTWKLQTGRRRRPTPSYISVAPTTCVRTASALLW